jgi:hypothetical protein
VVLALEERLGSFEAVGGRANELAGVDQVDARRLHIVDTVVNAPSEGLCLLERSRRRGSQALAGGAEDS